ncbi:MAG: beta-N-acetylhexosaminidase [Xanthomonadales bacterium]|nr:beta-N-acetylhexosaminidase [Xanthomonadales bacterium]
MAAGWDRAPAATLKALREHARTIADEVQGHDLDLSFTPVLDLGLGNRAIGDRALSADPKVCARLGAVYVRALQRAGMAATIKHFPGHGSILEDTHHEIAIDARPPELIAMRDLLPFAAGIRAGARAVMMAHIRYPAVDAVAAGYSSRWIHGVLRGALGFSGAVISDDIGMAAAFEAGGLEARIRAHEAAGCDLVLVCDPALVPEALATRVSRPLPVRLARLLRGRRRLDWA